MTGTDEVDLQLINVLQQVPRAAWVDIAPILNVSASTAASRWRRLRTQGLAWVTAHPSMGLGRPVSAVVELHVEPAHEPDVVSDLLRDPRIIGLDDVGFGGGLLLTVSVPGLPDYEALVRRLAGTPGATVQWEAPVTGVISHGADWRLDALDEPQQGEVSALLRRRHPAETGEAKAHQLEPVLQILAHDPRLSVAELARQLMRDPRTVRRQVDQIVRSPFVHFRCDAANEALGWPVTSLWMGTVPPAQLAAAAGALRALPGLRVAITLVGDANLCFSVLHRTMDGMSELSWRLGQIVPGFTPLRSRVLVRSHKRSGWLLGEDGRCTGEYVRPQVLCTENLDADAPRLPRARLRGVAT